MIKGLTNMERHAFVGEDLVVDVEMPDKVHAGIPTVATFGVFYSWITKVLLV